MVLKAIRSILDALRGLETSAGRALRQIYGRPDRLAARFPCFRSCEVERTAADPPKLGTSCEPCEPSIEAQPRR